MLLRIGACEIDCDRRRIVRDGAEQPLSRKAFDLLLALIDERPKVVDKDSLIKRVWPNTFVADANLAILIADVRAALGDSAQKPKLIRTHHRVGYSFIADVSEVSAATQSDHAPSFMLVAGRRRILLFEGTVTIGRDDMCDVVIDHPSVSRVHAWLTVSGDRLSIKDNGSKNGTRIDRVRLDDERTATSGQSIAFGRVEMTILGKDAIAGSTITSPDTAS